MSSWEAENVTTKEEVQKSEDDRIEEVIGCEVEASSILVAQLLLDCWVLNSCALP